MNDPQRPDIPTFIQAPAPATPEPAPAEGAVAAFDGMALVRALWALALDGALVALGARLGVDLHGWEAGCVIAGIFVAVAAPPVVADRQRLREAWHAAGVVIVGIGIGPSLTATLEPGLATAVLTTALATICLAAYGTFATPSVPFRLVAFAAFPLLPLLVARDAFGSSLAPDVALLVLSAFLITLMFSEARRTGGLVALVFPLVLALFIAVLRIAA